MGDAQVDLPACLPGCLPAWLPACLPGHLHSAHPTLLVPGAPGTQMGLEERAMEVLVVAASPWWLESKWLGQISMETQETGGMQLTLLI